MQSISTKTGDGGESGLANGERLPKDHLIFEVIGTLDELSAGRVSLRNYRGRQQL